MDAEVLVDKYQGPRITITITIGDGLGFAVQECPKRAPRLVVLKYSDYNSVVNLGPFTNKRIDELISHLQRLKIHAL